jgi:hypothetical protein
MESNVTLDEVVTMEWISHLGRPLCVHFTNIPEQLIFLTLSRFGSIYDAWNDEPHLLLFTKQKLLNGSSTLAEWDNLGSLACLSVRFGLEFNEDPNSRDVSCKQVERHM